MALDANIPLQSRLAQPVTSFQQGQQASQQNRLGQLQIQGAEQKLAQGNQPPSLQKHEIAMIRDANDTLLTEYEKLEQEVGPEQALAQITPKYQASVQYLSQVVPSLADRFSQTPDIEGMRALRGQSGGAEGADQVQSSKQLPGGLVQIVYKSGKVETVPAKEADAKLVMAAEDRGAELQGLRAGERELGKGGAKIGLQAYKDMGTARKNMSTLNEAIDLIDSGAETGVIQSKFPSFRAASIKLDNVKNRLGLDVIGSVTFGALSEAELNMALSTALPTNLEPAELRKWLVEKRDAQSKLADVLEEAAGYLTTPGNTVASWMKEKGVKGKSGARNQVESKQGGNMPSVSNW